ncbi:ras GTPase-activating protein-binding protein 2-like isoform X1 [Tripterygium wilfordii]|uniref:Ras GTPase-activating protein-binding protein 2-like isoform X1 n=1 Tax=Tripterygium wilfordii TaxID=458696 RepID=A0A7J7DHP3_TRIWF|nr:ras GTPase-activating protein-binding protein 2-like isoform X1 [Tripterygium wilfordii]
MQVMETQADSSTLTPQVVGNAFVQQYYSILSQSPELAHKFYEEASVLSRPELNGQMTSVTSMKVINDIILSMDYKNSRVEILTADAQASYNSGVIVLVTGFFTGEDHTRRQFSQTFFLAPQANGYVVLNDIFRYVEAKESGDVVTVDNVDEEGVPTAPLTPDSEPVHVLNSPVENHSTTTVEEDTNNSEEVDHSLANGKIEVLEERAAPADDQLVESQVDTLPVIEKTAPTVLEDGSKKTYASIVHALKVNASPFHVRIPPAKPVEPPRVIAAASETSVPVSNNAPERNNEKNNFDAARGHSIFVAKLPMNATVEQLREVFEKFGPIKRDGIQVRSYKEQRSCFGFVEFESASSVQSALEASPILIGDRKAPIEAKRGKSQHLSFALKLILQDNFGWKQILNQYVDIWTVSADSDGGKYPPRRDRFRGNNFRDGGNNFRDGGNFGGGRGYGRNEAEEGGFSGQGRASSGRNRDVNQKASLAKAGRQTATTDLSQGDEPSPFEPVACCNNISTVYLIRNAAA